MGGASEVDCFHCVKTVWFLQVLTSKTSKNVCKLYTELNF